jgi:Heterokaryon incompatibility protein (HET)
MPSTATNNPFRTLEMQESKRWLWKSLEESGPGRLKRTLDEYSSKDGPLHQENEARRTSMAEEDSLCDRCRSIDFTDVFKPQVVKPTGSPILDLGWVEKRSEWRRCPVCRLFLEVCPKFVRSGPCHVRAYSGLCVLTKKTARKEKYDCALGVLRGSTRSRAYKSWISYCRNQGFIVPEYPPTSRPLPQSLYRGCRLETTRIVYERLQEWLSRCQSSHSSTCGPRKIGRSIVTRCIDCDSSEIVSISSQDRYLALSYVWGSPSSAGEEDGQANMKLPISGVPRVVEDALTVVKALGERYLWVDKYCIDSTNEETRHYQIKNMDHIYEGAYATIVACAGSNSSFGLPGVGSTPRKRQPSARVGNQLLVSTLPELSSVLQNTIWATRGWTYQEAILSRRCLFFTEFQVYFLCAAMSCCEAVISRIDDTTLSSASNGMLTEELFREDLSSIMRDSKTSELQRLSQHITLYSRRHLTYSKDSLDAFRGILSRSQLYNYYGIPFAPRDSSDSFKNCQDMDLAFAKGLYWLHGMNTPGMEAVLSRRPEFPSWSWLGWKGSITYHPTCLQDYYVGPLAADGSDLDCRFWLEDKKGTRLRLWDVHTCSSETKSFPELSRYLIIEALCVRLRFQQTLMLGRSFHPFQRCPDSEFSICKCHPDTQHPKRSNMGLSETWGILELCEMRTHGDAMLDRLVGEVWSCILLSSGFCGREYFHNLMVVDWDGEVAHRVGIITLKSGNDDRGLFGRLSKTRCTVRLN